MSTDAELLGRYASEHSEAAFTELVQRHVDLVYSAALRLAGGDTHRAEDVTQQVFAEFARQAPRLARHPALAGWLYTTTRRMALRAQRTQQRRTAREQEAYAMNELLNQPSPEPEWGDLRNVLDEAMVELGEKDRFAVLLRYFQNKSLKEVGATLGLSENAARMRVERALEKLRTQLAHKGVTSTAAGLVLILSGHAVAAAPPAFVATLTSASLAQAAAAGGTTVTFLNWLTMTKLQTAILGAVIVAGVATPLAIQHQAHARLREQDRICQQQANQLAHAQLDNDQLSNQLARAESAPTLPPGQFNEVLRLRGEIGQLQSAVQELSSADTNAPLSRDEVLASMRQMYVDRVNKLKQYFAANPQEAVPELQLFTDADWLGTATYDHHRIDPDNSHRVGSTRSSAQIKFAMRQLSGAVRDYGRSHNGQFPTDLLQLMPYFKSPVDASVLQGWAILPNSSLPGRMKIDEEWVVTQKAPVNEKTDQRVVIGLKTTHLGSGGPEDWIP